MFAIIVTGGKQYKVQEGDVVFVEKLNAAEGEEVKFEEVLAVSGESFVTGKPTVEEMRHFLDCVETGKTPETSPEESIAGLEVIWELYQAEDEHRLADFTNIEFPF